MDKISADGLAKQHRLLTTAAHRGTLSELVLIDRIKKYVYLKDQDMTVSIGISWMEDHAQLFHRVVKRPYDFHRQFIHEGPYASLLLRRRDFLCVFSEDMRMSFARELIRGHSLANTHWVHTLLELGIDEAEVKALVIERIHLDISTRIVQKSSSFARVFISDGQAFTRSKTSHQGIWSLLGETSFFAVVTEIADYLPKQVLCKIDAIRSTFRLSTQSLIEQCLAKLTDLKGVKMTHLASMSARVLYDLLMRIRVDVDSSRKETIALFQLLQLIMPRLDADRAHAATLRARGLTQSVAIHELFCVMCRTLTDSAIEHCSALADWLTELRTGLEKAGWVFATAKPISYIALDGQEMVRIGLVLEDEAFLHDRYADWQIHAGDRVMFLPAAATRLKQALIVEMYPLSDY